MPLTSVQTGKRTICGEETQDEAQLEQELCRLQRQLHVMEGDRRAYSEESCNMLRKQQKEILSLKQESEQIDKILRLAQSDQNQNGDECDLDQLLTFMEKLDDYQRLCAAEEREIKDLDNQIAAVQEMINEQRRIQGSKTEEDSELMISKRLRVTENRLNQELIKFNKQLAKNASLREELDHLRQEKSVFDAIHSKLIKRLEATKRQINDYITQASHAYEERDEAQTKMIALKERSDKDIAQQEMEMKELQRIIKHDDKLKEFMGIKVHDRADLREEEMAKKQRGKDSNARDEDLEKQAIQQFEAAFERIKSAKGEQDIEKIVHDFIKGEEQNFALYNYVNELNDTIENIQEEIYSMQSEIERFQKDDVKNDEDRRKVIKEMELKAEQFRQEADEAEKRNVGVCKVLDEIRGGVERLFRSLRAGMTRKDCSGPVLTLGTTLYSHEEAECDSTTICDMLGSEEGVTNKNILQYMGIIEQRTMELIKIQQYIQMTKDLPKQEKKDAKNQQPPPSSQQEFKTSPRQVPVAIVPPNTVDDEDFLDDAEFRPLTRDEIKTYVMKNIGRKIANSEAAAKQAVKRNRAKSP